MQRTVSTLARNASEPSFKSRSLLLFTVFVNNTDPYGAASLGRECRFHCDLRRCLQQTSGFSAFKCFPSHAQQEAQQACDLCLFVLCSIYSHLSCCVIVCINITCLTKLINAWHHMPVELNLVALIFPVPLFVCVTQTLESAKQHMLLQKEQNQEKKRRKVNPTDGTTASLSGAALAYQGLRVGTRNLAWLSVRSEYQHGSNAP